MRLHVLKPQDRIQLDADPQWAEDFLGPEPVFTPQAAQVWSLYWRSRNATSADYPVDLDRSLSLAERLYAGMHPQRLADALQAMDGVFLGERSEQMKRKAKAKGDK